jgi:hypothetical protein
MTIKQLNKRTYSDSKTKLSGSQDVFITDLFATNAETYTGTEAEKAVTPYNLAAMLQKLVLATFTGHNDAGACTLTGATTDSIVLCIANLSTPGITPTTDFETLISVVDQIQQSATDNNSAVNYVILLAPVV